MRHLVGCCRWLKEVDVVGVRGLPRGCKVRAHVLVLLKFWF